MYDEDKKKRTANIFVDHINPIINPETGFTSWDDTIEGMFAEADNLQLLCKACHSVKSQEEISVAVARRGYYATNPREYTTYVSMKGRCTNPKVDCYKHYGGRGISVCQSWLDSFENFLKDMGNRPEVYTLERKNNDGNYEPSNCIWADWMEQASNRRDNIHIECDGVTDTLSGWSRKTGVGRATISYRIRNDFTVKEALGFLPKPDKQTLKDRRESVEDEKLND